VSWIAQSNSAADASEYFTFQVNEAAKTIAVTGVKLGNGVLNGFFVGASGGTTTRIQVYVEYTYEFELKTSGIITREPRNGNTIIIPFRVFPADLEITAQASDPAKLEVKSVSLNTLTGEGAVELTPLGEKNGLSVTVQAVNPRDRVNTPILRTQYINLRYDDLTVTPVFDLEAGSFSSYDPKTNTLYLGDGEQSLFHLRVAEDNADLENLSVFWQSVNGAAADNLAANQGGYISLSKEPGVSNSGEPLWRIGHGFDYISAEPYYLISRDLKFRVWKTIYSGDFYTVQIPHQFSQTTYYTSEWRSNQYETDSPIEIRTADPNTAVTGWYVHTNDWWDFLDHKQRAYLAVKSPSTIIADVMGGYDGTEKTYTVDMTQETRKEESDDDGNTSILASYRNGEVLHCEVFYEPVAPYAVSMARFQGNPNYFRPALSGDEYNWGGWWSGGNSWTKTFDAEPLHAYTTTTTSKNSAVLAAYYGQIKLTYKRFDGTSGEKVINVQIQRRDCESYNNGTWRGVSPGRWEMQ
jgi:hypothetical protein